MEADIDAAKVLNGASVERMSQASDQAPSWRRSSLGARWERVMGEGWAAEPRASYYARSAC
jgi:hypothetical protein